MDFVLNILRGLFECPSQAEGYQVIVQELVLIEAFEVIKVHCRHIVSGTTGWKDERPEMLVDEQDS